MSVFSITSKKAVANLRKNVFSRWHNDKKQSNNKLASHRLKQSLFSPSIHSKFKLLYSDQVFAIGSCFARGIEVALQRKGLSVISRAEEFEGFERVSSKVTGLGFTNKYSTFSILNEIKWALDPEATFPIGSIVDISEKSSIDPNINPTLNYVNRSETIHRRKIISEVMGRMKSCEVIFLTLGLVEVWYDEYEKIYLNMAPTAEMRKKNPQRYTFHLTSYEENLKNLEDIYSLLDKYGHPDFKIIVTVSPVPLMATFTDKDIVVANTYSKALLRTVVEVWGASHENVDYFPSYEIVMNSERKKVWQKDYRHVRRRMVAHIMTLFMANYLPRISKLDAFKKEFVLLKMAMIAKGRKWLKV